MKNIPNNSILVTADVVGLYPSILHESGLNAITEAPENRTRKSVPTSNTLQMLEFVLKNNYFEFNRNDKQQSSGTAIGTKCAPPYACVFMGRVERDILESQKLKAMAWLRYIDDIFSFGFMANKNFSVFSKNLIKLTLT